MRTATADDLPVRGKNAKIKAVVVATILDHLGGLVLPGTPVTGPVADPAMVLADVRRDL
ncbi:hypothetical protein ABGB16_31095 [Micromonospora sp. B11E3]|uniref:hypothetical protein n=1 Tax=Micromonospora sp. B11E3 TaxID=3153562 RepID=UPI00325F2C92